MSPPKGSVETSERPAKNTPARAAAGPPADPAPDANVDKIREILFGGQMQDYEQRFATLESRLAAAAAELREETRARLDALEAFTKKELAALSDRLATERRERTEAVAGAVGDLETADGAIELRIDALDERTADDGSQIRDQLLQQSKTASDDLRRVQRALSDRIDEEARALRSAKTDRQALAGLLADMAMRLSEPDSPEDAAS